MEDGYLYYSDAEDSKNEFTTSSASWEIMMRNRSEKRLREHGGSDCASSE
ncbi:MAG: hypothetical protein ACLT3Y_01775 [Ruminococcus callidus]